MAGYLFAVTLSPRGFTSADQYGVSWRSGLRTKRLVWADLHDIRQVTPPAAAVGPHRPQDVAYAYRVDGRRFLLPYLSAKELGDEGFRREVTLLRDVMNEQHGGARVADPLVEAHIARPAARYARRYRALTGRTSRTIFLVALIALIAIIVVCTTTFE
ncbi:hypothetical protein [Streptomyces racemochromogenes]|uniref:hypothetical protein n=1 Tax=Streptomyces racemochromogenes TaxID=67353 RepID=UPI0031E63CA2